MLTTAQIAKLEELGFHLVTVSFVHQFPYRLYKKEVRPNEFAPVDSCISVEVIDGFVRNVHSLIEKNTNEYVKNQYQSDLLELEKVGIK